MQSAGAGPCSTCATKPRQRENLYGLDDPETEEFGRQCLLARRMVERGVRFVELLPPGGKGIDRWDQHAGIWKRTPRQCQSCRQADRRAA